MAKQVQFRRGTTLEHSTFVGALGEVTVDTDKKVVVVHDGITSGGNPAARIADVTAANVNIAAAQSAISLLQIDFSYLDTQGAAAEITKLRANIIAANINIAELQSNARVQALAINQLNSDLGVLNSTVTTQSFSIGVIQSTLVTIQDGTLATNACVVAVSGTVTNNYNDQNSQISGLRANITAANVNISTVQANVQVNGNIFGSNIHATYALKANSGTATTSTTTGALVVAGGVGVSGSINIGGSALVIGASGGLGYGPGAGGAVTQATSRSTGVTLNKLSGAITLFTAAGATTWTTFVVTNSTVAATDTVSLSVQSATNIYVTSVTNIGAGTFTVAFVSTGGTASDTPIINFNVIKGATA